MEFEVNSICESGIRISLISGNHWKVNQNIATCVLSIRSGSAFETGFPLGLAHTAEHLVRRSDCDILKGFGEISTGWQRSVSLGKALTDLDNTHFFGACAKNELPRLASLFREMFESVRIQENMVQRARSEVLKERRYNLQFSASFLKAFERIYRLNFFGHPYQGYTFGSPSGILELKAPILRKFLERFYLPSNMVFRAFVPSVSERQLKELARVTGQILNDIKFPWKTAPTAKAFELSEKYGLQERHSKIFRERAGGPAALLSLRVTPTTQNWLALHIIDRLLFSETAPLTEKLRNQKLYRPKTSLPLTRYTGLYEIQTRQFYQTRNHIYDPKWLPTLFDTCLREFNRISKGNVSKKEYAIAVRKTISRHSRMADPTDWPRKADFLREMNDQQLLGRKPMGFSEKRARIKSLSLEEVTAVAENILNESNFRAVEIWEKNP